MSNRNVLLALTIALFIFKPVTFLRAADHLDAPLLQNNGSVDVNDLYVFQSPMNADNTVLIMTVNPFAGQVSGRTFSSDADYQFLIDNDGDALPDVTYSATFSAPAGGSQSLDVTREGVFFASGSTKTDISTSGGGTLRAGLFDDPFFFDSAGFQNNLNFTGDDTFAGANVSAIVLEVPSSELVSTSGPNIGVWARTVVGGSQVDRVGRPAINTVLIPSARKDEFNQANPDQDLNNFGANVQMTIESLNGGDAAHAAGLTGVLLPDVLTFDTSNAAGFLNGRRLADDVIDAELTLLTNSSTPIGDGVDANDVPFLDVFPYLVPEPSSIALVVLGLSAVGCYGRRQRGGNRA